MAEEKSDKDEAGKPCDGMDVVFPGPPTGDGGMHVLRHKGDHTLESGIVRPLKEGRPIQGELVRLEPREDGPGISVKSEGRFGPPMVNSEAYRDGWDAVFGKPKTEVN